MKCCDKCNQGRAACPCPEACMLPEDDMSDTARAAFIAIVAVVSLLAVAVVMSEVARAFQ